MAESSVFADELKKLLEASALSPEEVVAEVNKRGIPLPSYTFDYWLQGYFLPRSDGAFQLASILENIFSVDNNSLSDALLQDLSSGSSFVPGESAQSEIFGAVPVEEGERIRYATGANEIIDWEATLIQKVVRDEVRVSADLTMTHNKATILARVPRVPNPSFVVQILHSDGVTANKEDYFYDLSGIELKKQEIFEKNGLTICANHFVVPDDVIPGDLHQLSYSWDEVSQGPVERIGERYLAWSLDFYSCKVTFEGGIPEGVRYNTLEIFGDEEKELPCTIPLVHAGNTVGISTKSFGNIIGYFDVPSRAGFKE